MKLSRASLGRAGEDLAARDYRDRGYGILDRNWRCAFGEIDLVVTRASLIAFCEVKTRSGLAFGYPEEAVDPAKQARIRRLAAAWLSVHEGPWREVRFDVVAIVKRRGWAPTIHVVENAF